MWGCEGVEQSGKEKEKEKEKRKKKKEQEKEKEKDEKRIFGCFETFRHSFSFSLLLNQIISTTHPPIPPKYLSLSLWMNTQTHTSRTHIYHTNQQPSMSSPEFKSLPNSSFSFSKQHTQSPSLSQNNHFSCESSKSISSSLLSHSSHCIQECDLMNDIPLFLIHHTSHSIIPLSHGE